MTLNTRYREMRDNNFRQLYTTLPDNHRSNVILSETKICFERHVDRNETSIVFQILH